MGYGPMAPCMPYPFGLTPKGLLSTGVVLGGQVGLAAFATRALAMGWDHYVRAPSPLVGALMGGTTVAMTLPTLLFWRSLRRVQEDNITHHDHAIHALTAIGHGFRKALENPDLSAAARDRCLQNFEETLAHMRARLGALTRLVQRQAADNQQVVGLLCHFRPVPPLRHDPRLIRARLMLADLLAHRALWVDPPLMEATTGAARISLTALIDQWPGVSFYDRDRHLEKMASSLDAPPGLIKEDPTGWVVRHAWIEAVVGGALSALPNSQTRTNVMIDLLGRIHAQCLARYLRESRPPPTGFAEEQREALRQSLRLDTDNDNHMALRGASLGAMLRSEAPLLRAEAIALVERERIFGTAAPAIIILTNPHPPDVGTWREAVDDLKDLEREADASYAIAGALGAVRYNLAAVFRDQFRADPRPAVQADADWLAARIAAAIPELSEM